MTQVEQEFKEMLETHDWLYEFSDQLVVWRRGFEKEKVIKDFLKINPELKELYDKYNPYNPEY